jgi:pyruvate/2-oxoglutarate dehydrogenase complex dihydrolipoamide dehydrogenase (E3) component/uncharacterized membrane protein YdjX (TVP38/TMEM64 family)
VNKSRSLLVGVIGALVIAFFALDLSDYLSLEFLKEQQESIERYYREYPLRTILVYFAIYLLAAALSMPGAVWITLAGGAIFGVVTGTVIVSFASSIGATIAFLVSRFLLHDWVQNRFRRNLRAVNAGIEKDGPLYLFTLRVVPVFPFWIINLVMGLTTMRTGAFYLVSQIGMLPATIVYVNAGSQLAQIESASDIVSPDLLLALALLGLFPLAAQRLVTWVKARRALKGYVKPAHYDYNVVVIGAGSAGLVTAYITAAVKARVALVEKSRMGGDCLNTGCVPSKALIRSARFVSHCRRANEFGMKSALVDFDFAEVMERVHRVIREIEPHDSVERYTGLGVDCVSGEARIKSPYEVQVNDRTLTTRGIVVAAGAEPLVPPIPGLENIAYLTSDTLWDIRHLPKRLVVLGGGPIGCELSQCFARFGSEVTQIEMLPRLLGREDPDVSRLVEARLAAEGVDIRTGHVATGFDGEGDSKRMTCRYQEEEVTIEFDDLLVALGRRANTDDYGLKELGIGTTATGTIEVNEYLQTCIPTIYACGDVAGPYQFTHTASHQAWYAAVNALFGGIRRFRVDYSVIPWTTFTDPEVARVGLNETDARAQEIDYEVTSFDLGELDRSIADEATEGFVKVLTAPGKDRILGATIVGEHAGEMISEFVFAMRHNKGLNKILGTIHSYPTLAEANKYAAGAWKRAHAPQNLLRWLQRFHTWRRG